MGLDMYANKRYYISNYEKNPLTKILGKETIEKLLEAKFVTITKESMYWRKANHIHRFFVEQVQNDNDDCGEYYIPENTLRILKNKLEAVLNAYRKNKKEWIKVAEIELPTTEGFFF